jgi:hypothetical protein
MVTIEVVEVCDGSSTVDLPMIDPKERMQLPFGELVKGVNELKRYGGDYFRQKDYVKARKE